MDARRAEALPPPPADVMEAKQFLFLQNAIDYYSGDKPDHRRGDVGNRPPPRSHPLLHVDPDDDRTLSLTRWEDVGTDALRSLALAKGPHLRTVSLTDCPNLTDAMFEPFCSRLDGIVHLDLSGCTGIGDASIRAVARFCGSRTLVGLSLGGCSGITHEACGWMAGAIGHGSPRLRKLQSADLSGCPNVDDRGLRFLARGCGDTLAYLSLALCGQITDRGVRHLAKGCPRLKVLNLRGCRRISDKGIVFLSRGCPDLVSLNVSLCGNLADSAVIALSRGCIKLQALSLEGLRAITEAGICEVAKKCPGLMILNVTGCKITRSGLFALIRGIGYVKEAKSFLGFVPIDQAVSLKLQDQKKIIHEKAARKIQGRIREYKRRRAAEARRERNKKAHAANVVIFFLTGAARRLTICRRLKHEGGALLIQSVYRGWRGRLRAADTKLKCESLVKNTRSVLTVQSIFRGSLVRSHDTLVRPALEALKQFRRDEKRQHAATEIQSRTRRVLAKNRHSFMRELLARKISGAIAIQCLVRQAKSRRLFQNLEEKQQMLLMMQHRAALFMQSGSRQFLARKMLVVLLRKRNLEVKKRNECATLLQSAVRRMAGRNEAEHCRLENLRKMEATTVIQRHFRGSRILPWRYIKINQVAYFVRNRAFREYETSQVRSSTLKTLFDCSILNKRPREAKKDIISCDMSPLNIPAMSMISAYCKIWWPKDETYFMGVVRNFNKDTGLYYVEYIDGDYEHINFDMERDRIQIFINGCWKPLQSCQSYEHGIREQLDNR